MQKFELVLLSAAAVYNCRADYDNFPVKSINLEDADGVEYYVAPELNGRNGRISIEDPHPVHGIQAADSGFVMVGKADDNGEQEAFAVKLNWGGSYKWGWQSGKNGNDVANSVVQLPNGGDLIVAGYSTKNGVAKRTLWKLNVASGKLIWTFTGFGDGAGRHGAWETIDLDSTSSNVLLGGVNKKPDTDEMSFKSYGNVPNGEAVVMSMPVSALTGSSAPSGWSPTWVADSFSASYLTSKAVRPLASGNAIVLLYGEHPEKKMASLVELRASDGSIVWGPTDYGSEHGEGTDMVVAGNGDGFAISGHGDGGDSGALYGRLSKVSLDGTYLWSKSYGAGGHVLIKNECWGLQTMSDGGFAMACGTGIENCDGMPAEFKSDCKKDKPLALDTRPGAYPQIPAVWQSLAVRTDADGNLLWQRVDQYRESGDPALGNAKWEARSSASEYVIRCASGNMNMVQDEVSGIGLLRLNRGLSNPTPTSEPSTCSSGWCTKKCTNEDKCHKKCAKKCTNNCVCNQPSTGTCEDSTTWLFNKKNCKWVKKKPEKRCYKKGTDNGVKTYAYDACPVACEQCDRRLSGVNASSLLV